MEIKIPRHGILCSRHGIIFSWYVDHKDSFVLFGATNEHKCALTEGSASQYPSGLKIPRMTLKQTSFRGQPKVTQVSPILLPYFFWQ